MHNETVTAIYSYPYLQGLLEQWTAYKKQIPHENHALHAYVLDIIGFTELRLAMAQAIIARDYPK